MKKTLIILGIIVLGLIVYFTAAIDTGIQPPPNGKQPLKTGKAPVIASITPSKTSSCCVNIEGEGFLTDEATNEVIWTHKEKGFKIWGGGWLSKDGKNLIRIYTPISGDTPISSADYDVTVKNQNGISNSVSYKQEWGRNPPPLITNVYPLNASPGEKITIKTNGLLNESENNKIQFRNLPLPTGKIEASREDESGKLIKVNGFVIPAPNIEISAKAIDFATISFLLPKNLDKGKEYLISIRASGDILPFGDDFPYIIYKTGK